MYYLCGHGWNSGDRHSILKNFQYAAPIVKQGELDGSGEMFDVQSPSHSEMFPVIYFT